MPCCSCYWGFKGIPNKVAWFFFVSFIITSSTLIPIGIVKLLDCYNDVYKPCKDDKIFGNLSKKQCRAIADELCNARMYAGMLIAGIVLGCLVIIPIVFFSCFAKRPADKNSATVTAEPVVAVPVAQHAQS